MDYGFSKYILTFQVFGKTHRQLFHRINLILSSIMKFYKIFLTRPINLYAKTVTIDKYHYIVLKSKVTSRNDEIFS